MVKLLDCTLRDGGYYNNWDFSQELIAEYLLAMDALNIDFVEIGLRTLKNEGFKGGCAYSTDTFINNLVIPNGLKERIGVMINGAELMLPGDFSGKEDQAAYLEKTLEYLFYSKEDSPVTLVRIACHVKEFSACLPAATWLKKKGYLVGFNLMQVAECTSDELTDLASLASEYPIDVLYFADSMGSLTPERTSKIISSFRAGWAGDLGIHTHDNMGQAISNSKQAIKDGVCWLDGTVTGMGRGAGNAQTEYLTMIVDEFRDIKSSPIKLFELISGKFNEMKNHFGWGVNPYYYLAGKYNIHPSYIQEMLADKRYSNEDIMAVIDHLKIDGARKFSWDTLNSAKSFAAKEGGGDWAPVDLMKSKKVLILGNGPSILRYKCEIERHIALNKPFVIALNTQNNIDGSLIDLRVACHPIRLLADYQEYANLLQPLVVPVNMLSADVQQELAMKELFNFGMCVKPGVFEFSKENCTLPSPLVLAYALAVVNSGKVSEVLLAGFDGYTLDDSRRHEVDDIFDAYKINPNTVNLTSITPTKYDIATKSIYGMEK
ncbi:MAG: aldolase [Methylococcales symbiont of Hymedesmia sp. n. MRB-2018]|nr:MAG: aldolase [Methylococcales symbiont of Hymedesmia sp. n. MRB-2018]